MNIFNIYFPVAGIEFNVLLLIILGFCVGVIGGFFGVGGGWIITPALNIFGFHMAFAIGTGLSSIFGQSLGAIKKHQRMGNVDWKLGAFSIVTSLLGFEAGSRVVIALEKAGEVGVIIRWCYIIFLAGLGSFMFYDYFVLHERQLKRMEERKLSQISGKSLKVQTNGFSQKLHNINIPPMVSFPKSNIDQVSLWIIVIVFFCTGFLSGILGIGGGFIILPTLVYLIGLPTILAVGTSLMTVLVTAGFGCLIYALDGKVEVIAAVFMLFGASIGAQIGATAVKYIKGYGIRLLFAIMIIFTSFSVVTEQFYKMTMKSFFRTISGIILVGTALTMTAIIIGKLVIEYKKEYADKIETSPGKLTDTTDKK
jgi:uncharacterized membrane protein YfcA